MNQKSLAKEGKENDSRVDQTDHEGEYEDEEYEEEYKDEDPDEDLPVRSKQPKGGNGDTKDKYSPRSSSGFSRGEDHPKSKEKSLKKRDEESDVEEEYPADNSERASAKGKDSTLNRQSEYFNTDKAKTMADENKTWQKKDELKTHVETNKKERESDVDEEIDENIEDNYEFNF
eukprot:CAMPEP_0168353570 /NCGR_PEP_ID=MMETSP0213-20121227/23337_1 /TAXON_ID=151035 /ORGANISM="Euplotes harpa, Strain FSP1.4" /LENGTH=173 /DNA_ID=CAMNT_0008365221 /DNA_START=354 /DNA_END=875 /DNA_ORIENTATION=+